MALPALPGVVARSGAAAIAAARKMVIGDMPDFSSAMSLSQQGLAAINAGQKHVIVISDGDPQPPSRQLLDAFVNDGITITTGRVDSLDRIVFIHGEVGSRSHAADIGMLVIAMLQKHGLWGRPLERR